MGPGGSGTPFLLDGGKVTLWQLAAKETPKFCLFQTELERQLHIFFQPDEWDWSVPSPWWGRQAGRLSKGTKLPRVSSG